LYVGRNRASDDLARRLGLDAQTAGLILRLTRYYTDHALTPVVEALEANRVVSVIGEAGSGKSALAAALRRTPEDSNVPIGLVHATAFVSAASDVSELARGLAGQLLQVPGFDQATKRFARENQDRWDTLDVWQRELIGPLSLLRQPVRLMIDGVDQLDGTVDEAPLRRALSELLDTTERVSLVVTSRHDPKLPGSVAVTMPSLDDQTARQYLRSRQADEAIYERLMEIAQGRWLVLELAADQAAGEPAASLEGLYADLLARARSRHGPLLDRVVELLAAAGTGPVLPVDVLEAALRIYVEPRDRESDTTVP
jgi:energy-coupling factor transporter ATP-binding protein EcfA2